MRKISRIWISDLAEIKMGDPRYAVITLMNPFKLYYASLVLSRLALSSTIGREGAGKSAKSTCQALLGLWAKVTVTRAGTGRPVDWRYTES